MESTPNLRLPYLMAQQTQKHVTHNEAIRALDALVQLSVLDRNRSEPPMTSKNGDRHIVASQADGAWEGHEGEIAAFQDGGWLFYQPSTGWLCWVQDEDRLAAWDGNDWKDATSAGVNLNPVAGGLLGVNATADTTNRFSVKSDSVLFSHDELDVGGGDIRQVLNKASASDTASLVCQTGYSGRAEIGLAGDDDLHIKVSPDGASWHEAIVANANSGRVTFPNSKLGSFASAYSMSAQSIASYTYEVVQAFSLTESSTFSDPLSRLSDGELEFGDLDAGTWILTAFCQLSIGSERLSFFVEQSNDNGISWQRIGTGTSYGNAGSTFHHIPIPAIAIIQPGDRIKCTIWHSAGAPVELRDFHWAGVRVS